jgi:uncharacterized protein (DUF4415 family)
MRSAPGYGRFSGCIRPEWFLWLERIERIGKIQKDLHFCAGLFAGANSMNTTESETDWERVLTFKEGNAIPYEPEDGPYDPNDAEATRAWLAQADLIRKGKVVRRGKRGPQKAPTKKLISLRLSPEVIEHFKATGPGWQTRIDGALLESIKRRA